MQQRVKQAEQYRVLQQMTLKFDKRKLINKKKTNKNEDTTE